MYVSGWFNRTSDLDLTAGVDSHSALGAYDIYVLKLNVDGSYAWARTFGQASTFAYNVTRPGFWRYTGSSMTVDRAGNTYVSRCFIDTMDFDPTAGVDERTSAGLADIFVTQLKAYGSYGWTHTMGGLGDGCANAVATASNGDVYVTGYYQGMADFNAAGGGDIVTAVGGNDLFVSKFSVAAQHLNINVRKVIVEYPDEVKVKAAFTYDHALTGEDIISVSLAGVQLMQFPFSAFSGEDTGIFEYEGNDEEDEKGDLEVKIDLNRGLIRVEHGGLDLSEIDFSTAVSVGIAFGDATASDDTSTIIFDV